MEQKDMIEVDKVEPGEGKEVRKWNY